MCEVVKDVKVESKGQVMNERLLATLAFTLEAALRQDILQPEV